MAHKNEELLRKQDEALAKGDVEGMFSAFTDDVVAHIGGKSKLSGDYKGKQQLMEVFGKFMQALGESPEMTSHDIVAGDKHGFVLQTIRSTRKGDPVEIQSVGIFHFTGGKISEAWFVDVDPYTADPWYDRGL